jgi:hypothetical protein
LKFFNEDKFSSERAHPAEQKFIVFQHLLLYYRHQQWKDLGETEEDTPPSEILFVEGLTGTSKAFAIHTTCNISIATKGRNSADMSSAPTGCGTSTISRNTICCCCTIPTGPALKAKPTSTTQLVLKQIIVM